MRQGWLGRTLLVWVAVAAAGSTGRVSAAGPSASPLAELSAWACETCRAVAPRAILFCDCWARWKPRSWRDLDRDDLVYFAGHLVNVAAGFPVIQVPSSDFNRRMREEEAEWERIWFTDQPMHRTPVRVHGGIQ